MSLCYTAGSYELFTLYIVVCICQSQSLHLFLHFSSLVTISLHFTSVSVCFVNNFTCTPLFILYSTYKQCHIICIFMCPTYFIQQGNLQVQKFVLFMTNSQRIDAFELWCWRRLLRVPWTARRSNQSILKEISRGCSLEGMMLKLKLQYFGHLMQRVDPLEKTLMLGGIGGRRRRG